VAQFIGFFSIVEQILVFKQNLNSLRLGRLPRKSAFSFALGASTFALAAVLAPSLSAQSADEDAQTREWAWMSGSSSANPPGVYGASGTSAAGNIPGGRYCATSSADRSGNVWLFGGVGLDSTDAEGTLNDLWEFNPSTQQWTWRGGSSTVQSAGSSVYGTLGAPAAANIPGGRYCANSWIDISGNLWIFGGEGLDSTGVEALLNDLWEFDPSTRQWAWMGGAGAAQEPEAKEGTYGKLGTPAARNIPGSRTGAVSWTDGSGNFWLFGGGGADSTNTLGQLNDLWEFNPSTREWTWMSGSSTASGAEKGVYGAMGTPAAGNLPGGRHEAAGWTGSSGKLWLFGGDGVDASGTNGALNDLWEFDPSTREWTWVSGSSTVPGEFQGQPGVYGTLGASAAENIPGGRSWANSWTDSSGNLWLFGGIGYDSTGSRGYLNDLWEFNPSTGEWAWMGGSSTISTTDSGQPGVYGALGLPAGDNLPGARYGAASWTDSNGSFWLFGGMGYDSTGVFSELNDQWEQGRPASPPVFNLPAGTYAGTRTVTISDETAGAAIYYTSNGTTPTPHSTRYAGPVVLDMSVETLRAISVAPGYLPSPLAAATYEIQPGNANNATYSMSATAVTVAAGASGASTVTVRSANGYAGTVSLTCALASSPAGANELPTCSAGSSTVTLSSGATAATATIKVTTTAAKSAMARPEDAGKGHGWAGGAVLAVLVLLGIPARRRSWRAMLAVLVLMAAIGSLSGCGSQFSVSAIAPANSGITAGLYTFTVTGVGNPAQTPAPTTEFTLTIP
jgi:N-acetylneuraminic acid mutarotase